MSDTYTLLPLAIDWITFTYKFINNDSNANSMYNHIYNKGNKSIYIKNSYTFNILLKYKNAFWNTSVIIIIFLLRNFNIYYLKLL